MSLGLQQTVRLDGAELGKVAVGRGEQALAEGRASGFSARVKKSLKVA